MAIWDKPEDFWKSKSERFKSEADNYWRMAKNDEGDQFYGRAKTKYKQAEEAATKAKRAHDEGWTWKKKK
ncbi:hypothetical protein [uncultured Ruminococcus sp.]|uniref:hypothetical protein n=1 Tax=uncultured Ruminococcus sp. TaxID=165186 RepID=UPI0025DD6195|nr:hypothetical protein [uncultured Ruminococcus sp.]